MPGRPTRVASGGGGRKHPLVLRRAARSETGTLDGMDTDLLDRWNGLLDHPAAPAAGREVLARWAEPHRRYHGLEHLREVLDRIDELGTEASDADAVRLAAFFHDAVYDPASPANEQRSARLAEDVLPGLGVEPARVLDVARLVRVTASHVPASAEDRDGAVLCDADLAILAASPDDYAAYAAGVRAEYAHLDDPTFRAGRTDVLTSLLDRPQLFWTRSGRQRWEERARQHLAAERTLLRAAD